MTESEILEKVRGILKAIPSIEKTVVVPYANPDAKLRRIPNAIRFEEFIDNAPARFTVIADRQGCLCVAHGAGPLRIGGVRNGRR